MKWLDDFHPIFSAIVFISIGLAIGLFILYLFFNPNSIWHIALKIFICSSFVAIAFLLIRESFFIRKSIRDAGRGK